MNGEEGCFLFFVLGIMFIVLIKLAFIGIIIWAIIELVQHLTGG